MPAQVQVLVVQAQSQVQVVVVRFSGSKWLQRGFVRVQDGELGICASQEHAKEVKLPFIWLVQVQGSLDSVPVSTIERGDKIE